MEKSTENSNGEKILDILNASTLGTPFKSFLQFKSDDGRLYKPNYTKLHPAPDKCPPELGFAVNLPRTALFSVPGSGNTWVRHLLQQATGIYTGSVYKDKDLIKKGFKEEKIDGTVLVIKSHLRAVNDLNGVLYDRAVLIYRLPYEAVIAEYNRRHSPGSTHTGHANYQNLNRKVIDNLIKDWINMNKKWMLEFKNPLHVVSYYDLKSNLENTMERLLNFLEWEVSPQQLMCLGEHQEGSFHRKAGPSTEGFFTKEQLKTMNQHAEEFKTYFAQRVKKGLLLSV